MSILGSLFGQDQRNSINKSYKQSQGMLEQGYGDAQNALTQYYGQAMQGLQPYMQQGQAANKLYMDYLGVNGPEAQRAAFTSFQTDPGYEMQLQQGINALDRSAASRGGLYSGAAMKALDSYGQGTMANAFAQRMGMLGGAAQQGQGMAQYGAGLTAQQGGQLGSLAWGYGQQSAANKINQGNALAGAANIGINNMLGIAGLGLKAGGFGGFGMPNRGG